MLVGIDWSGSGHAVCVETDAGDIVVEFMINHSRPGFNKLRRHLYRHGVPGDYVVAIERPDGRLVDYLLETGCGVVCVSPKAIHRFRFGERPSGAKCDAADARLICEYLRIRRNHLMVLEPFSPELVALRVLVRCRDELVKARVRVTNQLGANLEMFWPGPHKLFSSLDTKIAVRFLERWPEPAALTEADIAALCRECGYHKRSPAELLGRLRDAVPPKAGGPETTARGQVVTTQLNVLKTLRHEIAAIDDQIHTAFWAHPHAPVFASLPRAGTINAAQILAEWGDTPGRYHTADSVAAYAGVVPVTKQSGRRHSVHFRHACNKRLRRALTIFAANSRHSSNWADNAYHGAIDRGLPHSTATRTLARRWVKVIFACTETNTPYDLDRHHSATRQSTPAALSAQ